MERKLVSQSEAIKLINQGYTIKSDTSDGYVEIKKKTRSGLYETRIYANNSPKAEVMNGNFGNLLKFINNFNDYYVYM